MVDEVVRMILGSAKDYDGRFPLLIKILDASQKLLQVHPPAHKAAELNGEPTEMWYRGRGTGGGYLCRTEERIYGG